MRGSSLWGHPRLYGYVDATALATCLHETGQLPIMNGAFLSHSPDAAHPAHADSRSLHVFSFGSFHFGHCTGSSPNPQPCSASGLL